MFVEFKDLGLPFTKIPQSTLCTLNYWLASIPREKQDLAWLDGGQFIRFVVGIFAASEFDIDTFPLTESHLEAYKKALRERGKGEQIEIVNRKIRHARSIIKFVQASKTKHP